MEACGPIPDPFPIVYDYRYYRYKFICLLHPRYIFICVYPVCCFIPSGIVCTALCCALLTLSDIPQHLAFTVLYHGGYIAINTYLHNRQSLRRALYVLHVFPARNMVSLCNSSAQDFALAAKSVRICGGQKRIRPLCRRQKWNRPDSVTTKPKAE